ncbi:hypothetical protein ACWDAQ_13705, partial [Streptomyces sp. NPDC001139]
PAGIRARTTKPPPALRSALKSPPRMPTRSRRGTPVFLDLHVKVAKDWQRDPKQLRRLGF